jgi:hypothetical protein
MASEPARPLLRGRGRRKKRERKGKREKKTEKGNRGARVRVTRLLGFTVGRRSLGSAGRAGRSGHRSPAGGWDRDLVGDEASGSATRRLSGRAAAKRSAAEALDGGALTQR